MTTIEPDRQARQQIRLLSDGPLYREALDFIEAQGTVDGRTQMSSLLSYTQSWKDLTDFVRHQSQRDWLGKKSYYGQFYAALDSYFQQLYRRSMEWFPPPEACQTKRKKRDWHEAHAIEVAREFAQHLAFENLYRERSRS